MVYIVIGYNNVEIILFSCIVLKEEWKKYYFISVYCICKNECFMWLLNVLFYSIDVFKVVVGIY